MRSRERERVRVWWYEKYDMLVMLRYGGELRNVRYVLDPMEAEESIVEQECVDFHMDQPYLYSML